MKALAWILLILIIVIAGFLLYNYYVPKNDLEPVVSNSGCLTSAEKSQYGLLQTDKYKLFLPDNWETAQISGTDPDATKNFKINKSDEFEFFSVWAKGYSNDADALLLDTLKSLKDYKIESTSTTKTAKGVTLKKMLVSFTTDIGQFKQEMLAYTKDNKGYLLLLRVKTYNYDTYKNKIEKISCSFETK